MPATLALKSKLERKYQIMHLLRQDIDAKKRTFDEMFNQIIGFKENIGEGINNLKEMP